jgi:hypothetical protein
MDSRSKQLEQILASAAVDDVALHTRCKSWIQTTVKDNVAVRAFCIGVIGFIILMVLKPPFVMSFQYDERRPWKAVSSISWISVITTLAVLVLTAVVVPACVRSGT